MSAAHANAKVAGNAVRCDMVVVLFELIDGFRGSVELATCGAGCQGRLELGREGTVEHAAWCRGRGIRWSNGGLLGDEPDGLADPVELGHRRGCGAAFL